MKNQLKTKILLFFGVCTLFGFNSNSIENDMIQKAESYYVKGEFQNSIVVYERILEMNLHSPSIYFNLGNAYFQINELGNSRWAYETGLIYFPRSSELRSNFETLKKTITNDIAIDSNTFNRILKMVTLNELINSICVLLFLLTILFILRKYRKINDIFYPNSIIIFSLFFLTFIIILKVILSKEFQGIVIANQPEVFIELENKIIDNNIVLFDGNKVSIINQKKNFYEISLIDGRKGWINKNQLRNL